MLFRSEAEFGIKLNRDIDPKLVSFDYILASIESIYPLIEIHNLVFNGVEPHGQNFLLIMLCMPEWFWGQKLNFLKIKKQLTLN